MVMQTEFVLKWERLERSNYMYRIDKQRNTSNNRCSKTNRTIESSVKRHAGIAHVRFAYLKRIRHKTATFRCQTVASC